MVEDVAVVGLGEPGYDREHSAAIDELVHEAARAALDDAGIGHQAVDNLVVCASDLEDGRAISSMVTACPAGGYRKDFLKTTDTGVHALALAAMRMRTGVFDTTLVVSWAKQSETDEPQIRRLEADPMFRRGTGLGHVTGHALTASAYAAETPDADEAANAVVERNTRHAAANERAIPQSTTTGEAAATSDLVSSPLRVAHLPDPCDGACAIVLASGTTAADMGAEPVWLQGVGWETDGYDKSTRSPGELAALGGAATRAFAEAGIDDPVTALDAVEIHEQSAYHELPALESLGLVDQKRAPAAVLDGQFGADGRVTVNPSGGPFAANPLIATGLARVAAGARQVRSGESDRVAATATAGFTDQVHGVAVLGGDGA